MSHKKTWACIKPDGDGCDGDHMDERKTVDELAKEYCRDFFVHEWDEEIAREGRTQCEEVFKAGWAARQSEIDEKDRRVSSLENGSYPAAAKKDIYCLKQKIDRLEQALETAIDKLEEISMESHHSLKNKDKEFHNKHAKRALAEIDAIMKKVDE